MAIDMSQFYQVFFEETAEHLASMESLLLNLDTEAPSLDDLNAIFRAAHSIKGGSGTFGFTDMTEVTHVLESLLDRLRKEELAITPEMVTAFLDAGDVLRMQLDGHQSGAGVDGSRVDEIRARLHAFTGGGLTPAAPTLASSASAAADDAIREAFSIQADADQVAIGERGAVDEGYGFFDAPLAAPAEPASADAAYGLFESAPDAPSGAGPVDENPALARNAGRRASDAPAPEPVRVGRRDTDKVAVPAGKGDVSIRVAVEKVDQLVNLAGELVITQAMLTQIATDLDAGGADGGMPAALYERMTAGLAQLARNTRDLQEAAMSIRMLPIGFVFSRFPRVVRDVAGKLGKQVELRTFGEGTELDKGLIEKITDPLTHLVRNSLDHGIETPEKRMAAGKDPKGTITLSAYHQGGNIVIDVSDDGGGLPRDRILAKAKERGLAVSDDMPDAEVWQLIFAPGFSTAEVVTDVSGRGVGMDVVKRNIEGLGGRVEIESTPGQGTRINIRLPLTLAILDGMSVAVGDETFIVPLTVVVESLQPSTGNVRTIAGEGQVVHIRGEYLPLIPLWRVFNVDRCVKDPSRGILIIVETGQGRAALFVDELTGQHQVVIKSMESNYRKVPGISGATIMGNGRVALILDVTGIVRMSRLIAREAA